MTVFKDIIAPHSEEQFFAQYWGVKPLHVPARGGGGRLLDWSRANALLGMRGYWTDTRLKLVLNTAPIPRERYCDLTSTIGEWQWLANPAKVRAMLAMGATVVANGADFASHELRVAGEVLDRKLGGLSGANLYLSFQGVSGFGPHYDVSEVFAFHCEGEKTWRIYENREDNPTGFPGGETSAVVEQLKRAAGKPATEIRMRPGDMLYIPRGWYHDALATSDATMHVTFSLSYHNGRTFLGALEQATQEVSLFRQYLPDAEVQGEAALRSHLQTLGKTLAELAASPEMVAAVRMMQQNSKWSTGTYDLPRRSAFRPFRATGQLVDIVWMENGCVVHSGGSELALSHAHAPAADWISRRSIFSDLELHGQFPSFDTATLDQLIADFVRLGVVKPG